MIRHITKIKYRIRRSWKKCYLFCIIRDKRIFQKIKIKDEYPGKEQKRKAAGIEELEYNFWYDSQGMNDNVESDLRKPWQPCKDIKLYFSGNVGISEGWKQERVHCNIHYKPYHNWKYMRQMGEKVYRTLPSNHCLIIWIWPIALALRLGEKGYFFSSFF